MKCNNACTVLKQIHCMYVSNRSSFVPFASRERVVTLWSAPLRRADFNATGCGAIMITTHLIYDIIVHHWSRPATFNCRQFLLSEVILAVMIWCTLCACFSTSIPWPMHGRVGHLFF